MMAPKMQYVNLGNSGLRVSKLILGTMTFGSKKWGSWLVEEAEALPIIKYAIDRGITTIDTADVYSNGATEKIIAKAIETYKIPRERLTICTKVFFGVDETPGAMPFISDMCTNDGETVNRVGLSRKHIFDAVQGSMRRLGTYIDVLYLHRLDTTPPTEIMEALNDVVRNGWVRYIAASSMPAWQFQNMQNIAERNGWAKFIAMQHYHHLLYREEEREMMPYCNATGVGLVAWSALARGLLTRPWSDDDVTERQKNDIFIPMLLKDRQDESDKRIVAKVQELAGKRGVSMATIATAWSLKKGCLPITGANSKERMDDALDALTIELTDDEVKQLEEPYMAKAAFQF